MPTLLKYMYFSNNRYGDLYNHYYNPHVCCDILVQKD